VYTEKYSMQEVVERWMQLYKGPMLVHRWLKESESITRMANEEDNCKGRFWEGRYKSQALLDEAAVLSCMAYVDLNPVRAGKENTLSESEFTFIQQHPYDYKEQQSIRALGVKCLFQK